MGKTYKMNKKEKREKQSMELEGWGDRTDLEDDEGGERMNRIYCVNQNFNI